MQKTVYVAMIGAATAIELSKYTQSKTSSGPIKKEEELLSLSNQKSPIPADSS